MVIYFFPFSLSAFMDKYKKDIILIPKDLITYSTFPVFHYKTGNIP